MRCGFPAVALALVCATSAAVAADAVEGAPAPPIAPAVIHRVVLVDATPELVHAARAALAPWRIEVIAAAAAPARPVDAMAATVIATERSGDRVAWIAAGELVVLDPTTGAIDRRPAPGGARDPAAAASVALSLKTLLRLPPPPESPALAGDLVVEAPGEPPPPPPPDRLRIVPEVGAAMRFPFQGTVDSHPRFTVGVGLAHRRWPALRPSVIAGFGPSAEAGRAGLQGRWSDFELGAQLAIEVPLTRAWAIVPRARLTAHRTHLTGDAGPMEIDETAVAGEAGVDLALWWRAGSFRAGVGAGLGLWLGLPDFQRMNVNVFEAPTGNGHVFGTLLIDL